MSLLVSCALGFATTFTMVGVGMYLASSGVITSSTFYLADGAWVVELVEWPLGEKLLARTSPPLTAHPPPELAPATVRDLRLPWWRKELQQPSFEAGQQEHHVRDVIGGWPFLALHMESELRLSAATAQIQRTTWHVYWMALIANLAILSFGWLVMIRGPGAIRRAIRQRTGRCVRCAYDLRKSPTSTCSECGTDMTVLRDEARQSARRYITAAIFVGLIAIVPLAQGRQRAVEQQAWFSSGGWLNEVEAGNHYRADYQIESFVERVQRIDGHEQAILERLEQLTELKRTRVYGFVTKLVDSDPRESYLPVLDRCVDLAADRDRVWVVERYGNYPWPLIADRVKSAYEQYDDDYIWIGVMSALGSSWHAHPDPAYRDDFKAFLQQIAEHAEGQVAAHAITLLFRLRLIHPSAAQELLNDLANRDPDVRHSERFRRLYETIKSGE
jgi:hypothetical protein